MRFLKKLLLGVYIYLGAFTVTVLMVFAITGTEPTALIGCVFGVAGIESMIGALIKASETKKTSDKE